MVGQRGHGGQCWWSCLTRWQKGGGRRKKGLGLGLGQPRTGPPGSTVLGGAVSQQPWVSMSWWGTQVWAVTWFLAPWTLPLSMMDVTVCVCSVFRAYPGDPGRFPWPRRCPQADGALPSWRRGGGLSAAAAWRVSLL